ncbi:hypothetical protein ASD11_05620 [Aeromicrobium sp. Root495]|uniref:lipopolysaccharide biosynthesis protein n=1 Tax=Aeromicrobium sp. Root495 TaxID=1736550 RepID=UPI0006F8C987|nr:oligosaccharide flippase family protein [Aeromicrobium sp. Root495]KQY59082.1 hypothetical protein ASD11_05620 [Aeromicrobium sp. Root495]
MTSNAPGAGLRGTTVVAAGMMVSNVTVYGFSVASARLLVPAELGAVTALLGILLIGNVLSLGLQATTARRLAIDPEHQGEVIGVVRRVTVLAGLAGGAVVAAASVVLTPALKLDSPVPVLLCGLTLVPLTIMGAQAGIAQGTEQWQLLARIYVANGVGRLLCGAAALVIDPSTTSAMVGIAVGACVPVLAGLPVLKAPSTPTTAASRRPFITEAFHGTHALLAYFVLSSADSLIARNQFDEHDSGLYAAGLILTKAALFLPQFVSVVLFPALARDTTSRSRLRAVSLVAACCALAVAATAILPRLALVLVGGPQYEEIADRLWLFALSGSCLALANVLVLDALARRAHGVVALIWVAVGVVGGVAYGTDVHITGLVVTVGAVSGVLAAALGLAPLVTRRRAASDRSTTPH